VAAVPAGCRGARDGKCEHEGHEQASLGAGGERDQVTHTGGGSVREREAQDHGRDGEQHPIDERFHGEPGERSWSLDARAPETEEACRVAAQAGRSDRRRCIAVGVDRHRPPKREVGRARHKETEPDRTYDHVGGAKRERREMKGEGWEHRSD